jgi:hypothetical protein
MIGNCLIRLAPGFNLIILNFSPFIFLFDKFFVKKFIYSFNILDTFVIVHFLVKAGLNHLIETKQGAQYLTGENLKVVWPEFSTLS